MSDPGEVTLLLQRWNAGDGDALDALIPFVYPRLRQLAAAFLRREPSALTLQPTALVNELYLKLLQQRKASWDDRVHFYVFAAKLMRRILADHARAVHTEKRGAGFARIPLCEDLAWCDVNTACVIDLNRALDELEPIDSRKVRLVELRYFIGCTVDEAAALLRISSATAERDLRMVLTWLYSKLVMPHPTPAEHVHEGN